MAQKGRAAAGCHVICSWYSSPFMCPCWLWHLLKSSSHYCTRKNWKWSGLILPIYIWEINWKNLEHVRQLQYLGILFRYNTMKRTQGGGPSVSRTPLMLLDNKYSSFAILNTRKLVNAKIKRMYTMFISLLKINYFCYPWSIFYSVFSRDGVQKIRNLLIWP